MQAEFLLLSARFIGLSTGISLKLTRVVEKPVKFLLFRMNPGVAVLNLIANSSSIHHHHHHIHLYCFSYSEQENVTVLQLSSYVDPSHSLGSEPKCRRISRT